jgi:pimeloyl-ACP methyl ester carboxylesterase
MIGGSGVHNHNSTIGPHKILQQLARGLAQRGIATLYFDRRPIFNLASFNANPDLDHEVVIDAASALAYAATVPEVDSHKIYLLGHSLGGELAPYIVAMRLAQQPASVHGMVLMSGVARPFDVTTLEQARVIKAAQGATPAQVDQVIASWTAVFDAARDPQTPASDPLGVGTIKAPAQYWRDWLSRNPVPGLQSLGLPALVLGGTNDLNPSHQDFEMLRQAATASGSASLELPGLNHEYIAAPGDGSTTFVAAQVAPAVLDTIAQWVTTGHIDSKLR